MTNPVASGGGGSAYEFAVAAALMSKLLLGREFVLPGQVIGLRFQNPAATPRFDDVTVTTRAASGSLATTEVQVRLGVTVASADEDFKALVRGMLTGIDERATEFEADARCFVLVCARRNPSTDALGVLRERARAHDDVSSFWLDARTPGRFSADVTRRLTSLRQMVEDLADQWRADELTFRVLRALQIRAWELIGDTASARVEVINALAERVSPPDHDLARATFAALLDLAHFLVPNGGVVHRRGLVLRLPESLRNPWVSGSSTRERSLDEIERLSQSRRHRRIATLGLPPSVVESVLEEVTTGSQIEPPTLAMGSLRFVVGDVGIGKSTIAEQVHVNAISDAREDVTKPLPIFIEAAEVAGSLPDFVRLRTNGLGDVAQLGAHIVLDALDEVGSDRAQVLVRQLRDVVGAWPNSSGMVTSRPGHEFPESETVWCSPLTREAAEEFVRRLSSAQTSFLGLTESVADAITRPLFALLLVKHRMEVTSGTVASSADLVRHLVSRSVASALSRSADAEALLQRIAVRVIAEDTQRVSIAEISSSLADRALLLQTHLITVTSDDYVEIPVRLVTEWLAAQSVLADPTPVHAQMGDPHALNRWRHALTVAVGIGGFDEVSRLLEPLIEQHPGIAAVTVVDGIKRWSNDGTPAPVSWLESGRRARIAFAGWSRALPELCPPVVPVRDGRLLPVGVDTTDGRITFSWYEGADWTTRDEVMQISSDMQPLNARDRGFRSFRSGSIGTESSWWWRWTFEDVTQRLEALLNRRGLPTPVIAQKEIDWRLAHDITRRRHNPWRERQIAVAELRTVLADFPSSAPGSELLVVDGTREWSVNEAVDLISRYEREGIENVIAPWTQADRTDRSAGWIDNLWSTPALAERTSQVLDAGLQAYMELVESHFPRFKMELPIAALWPVHLRFWIQYTTGFGNEEIPFWAWHIEPLPSGEPTRVTAEDGNPPPWGDLGDSLLALIAEHRPSAAGLIYPPIAHGELPICGTTPALDNAYAWLWDDLKKIHWLRGLPRRD